MSKNKDRNQQTICLDNKVNQILRFMSGITETSMTDIINHVLQKVVFSLDPKEYSDQKELFNEIDKQIKKSLYRTQEEAKEELVETKKEIGRVKRRLEKLKERKLELEQKLERD